MPTVDLIVYGKIREIRRYWGADLTVGPWYHITAEKNPNHEQRNIAGYLTHSIGTVLDKLTHALEINIEEHKDYENRKWYHSCNLVSLKSSPFGGKTVGVEYVNDNTGKPLLLKKGKTLNIPTRGGAAQLKL